MRNILFICLFLIASVVHAQSDDENNFVVVNQINITGNDITRREIVFREMTIHSGDTISRTELEKHIKESRENLLNTSLFNFADITVNEVSDSENINIDVQLTERWYLWPIPFLRYADRNIMAYFEEGRLERISYGGDLIYNNFLGRQHRLDLTIIAGYNQKYAISYDIPYLTNKKMMGLYVAAGFCFDKESAYATKKDKVVFYQAASGHAHSAFNAVVNPYLRLGYRDKLSLAITYDDRDFDKNISILNDDFANAHGTRFQYFSLSLDFKHDYRDIHPYPLNGYYAELEVTKKGLGLTDSDVDFFYAKMIFDKYFHINGRWYWASNVTLRLADSGSPRYFLNEGLGYGNDIVRGYDLYVVDAADYGIMKNNLKFEIYKKAEGYISGIRNNKFGKFHLAFYANLFFDFGYAWKGGDDDLSRLREKMLFGTGIGLDMVTYYDRVFRFEYGFNTLGEGALSIHFVAPI